MPSPFPGVDPYIENLGILRDFHGTFLTFLRAALVQRLPPNYAALLDEEFRIFEEDHPERRPRSYRPDVAVARTGPAVVEGRGGVAVAEPVTVPLPEPVPEEERPLWIEIRRVPDRELVTILELLSPTNKDGHGRREYIAKRNALLERDIHLVELDLLLSGPRLPMGAALPRGDFYAFVARADRRPECEVYAWMLRQPLPTIAIPLRAPDPDVPLDLAAAYATAYDAGGYNRLPLYDRPLELPLAVADRAWAAERARGAAP